jgi:hypothetical protein
MGLALCSLLSERPTCPTGFIGVERHAEGWGTRGVVDGARRCDVRVRGMVRGPGPTGTAGSTSRMHASHLALVAHTRVVSIYNTDFEVRGVPVMIVRKGNEDATANTYITRTHTTTRHRGEAHTRAKG